MFKATRLWGQGGDTVVSRGEIPRSWSFLPTATRTLVYLNTKFPRLILLILDQSTRLQTQHYHLLDIAVLEGYMNKV